MRAAHRRRVRASGVLLLVLALLVRSSPAFAAPSERDLAYERAVMAEEAGDHPLAALHYARAYQLTPAAESGPRLLFLRAALAASLRIAADAPAAVLHLCQGRELLRAHARETAELLPEEGASLAELERRIAASDDPSCASLQPAEPPPAREAPEPAPEPAATPKPAAPAPAPASQRSPLARPLLIGGGVALGLSVGSFAMLGAGVSIAARASERGRQLCWEEPAGCDLISPEVLDIRADGRRGDTLVRAGAALGAITAIAGLALVITGARLTRPRRVALAPGRLVVRF